MVKATSKQSAITVIAAPVSTVTTNRKSMSFFAGLMVLGSLGGWF